ncbi:MAG: Uma2 family endonuclease [Pyrinomonadaceae bacterium]
MQNLQDITIDREAPPQYLPQSDEILRLIEGLPADSELILHGQSWDDYENLLNSFVNPAGLHIAYDGETLQIMTVSITHEKYVRLLERLIHVLSTTLRIEVESCGSATIKLSEVMKGHEPDACYYVQNVDTIAGRSDIDFSVDPMPDIAVEIDHHNVSLDKLSIYASLGFPEVWRYHRDQFEFYTLDGGNYHRVETSIAFPMLEAKVLASFLNRGRKEKQSTILRDFELWLRENQT